MHIPASQGIQIPLRVNLASSQSEHGYAPHFGYGISNKLGRPVSVIMTPGVYSAHTRCTQRPAVVSLNKPPTKENHANSM